METERIDRRRITEQTNRKLTNLYIVWLEWPEKCFRASEADLRHLKTLVPKGSRIVRARSEASFLRALPKATHAIVWNFKPEWFEKATRLKALATPAAGQELVPTVGPKGVRIHFGHFHGEIMAESVVGFAVAWAHGFFAAGKAPEAERGWPRTWLSDKCHEVAGTKAIVIGYGHVGRAIGRKLTALGVGVLGVTRHGVFRESAGGETPERVAERLAAAALRDADWLVMALPSTTGTDNFLDAAMLRKLPRKCVIINVGRGNSIDEDALYAALKSGRIAGAYLDVRKHEPSKTVPEFGTNAWLETLENCIVMPHASAFSPNYVRRCFEELKDDGII